MWPIGWLFRSNLPRNIHEGTASVPTRNLHTFIIDRSTFGSEEQLYLWYLFPWKSTLSLLYLWAVYHLPSSNTKLVFSERRNIQALQPKWRASWKCWRKNPSDFISASSISWEISISAITYPLAIAVFDDEVDVIGTVSLDRLWIGDGGIRVFPISWVLAIFDDLTSADFLMVGGEVVWVFSVPLIWKFL